MRNRFRTVICASLMAALAFGLITTAYGSSVDSLQHDIEELQKAQEELQQQMDNVQNEQSSLQSDLQNAEDQISNLEKQKQELEQSMQQLDEQLGAAVKEMTDIADSQQAKQQEIDIASGNLAKAEQTEQKQYESMKLRIRYMYEQGSQNYLAVLFSAVDASDLLSRAEYISSIYRYDRKMLTQYEDARKQVAEKKAILSREYEELEELRAQAEEKKASVETLMAQKNQELEKYNQTISATKTLAEQYQEQIEYRDAVIAQLEAAAYDASVQQDAALASLTSILNQAQNEQRDAAEQTAARAVLQKMAEAEQKKLAEEGYTLTVDPGSLFVWPCPSSTRITSPYGWRIHPIYHDNRFHNGIDIAADMGSAIIATYQGTVIGAGYNTSMGNYVMIDHGQGLVTIYMHASYLCVSAGDYVETGQLIALVGATGDATGPHLHFTTRLNGNYVSPWNYVSN